MRKVVSLCQPQRLVRAAWSTHLVARRSLGISLDVKTVTLALEVGGRVVLVNALVIASR